MKQLYLLFLLFANLAAFSQTTYNGLPVIKAQKMKADYRVNDLWTKGSWGIDPALNPDVLSVPCFSKSVQFAFYTDIDSITFTLDAQKVQQFYVLGPDTRYALTEIRGFNFDPIQFDAAAKPGRYAFWYEADATNTYLDTLKTQYHLEDVVKGAKSDSAKALRMLKWVHDQWRHDGDNEPSKSDALTILAEVKQGKNFRCVEYGIVATAALNAIGLPARVLGLKTKDVETTAYGAGHVLLEVYLKDLKKWVLLDGQWDAMPVLNSVPLNAVEFQQAIVSNYDALQIRSLSATDKAAHVKWVYPYLYYFDVRFDNREGLDLKRHTHDGNTRLMLVPAGAKNPMIFQKKSPIKQMIYTQSLADFYASPL